MSSNHSKRQGWTVDDRPYVKKDAGGKNRSIDKMLKLLRRRLSKNGKLQEYRERQYYTSPSEERQEARKEKEYELDKIREAMRAESSISGSR